MTAIRWLSGQSGDWSNASDWNWGTAPTLGDNAIFGSGVSYTVTVSGAASAANLNFDAASAVLEETTGSLDVSGGFNLHAGEVELDGTNTIGSIAMFGGVLSAASSGSLGSGSLDMFGGELLGASTETLASGLGLSGVDKIAAATGTTLTLAGAATLSGAVSLEFGSASATGEIAWQASVVNLAVNATASLNVRGGTLQFGNFDQGLTALGSAWSSLDVENGAVLDLNGVPTSATQLEGSGTLESTPITNITVSGGYFSGNIEGDIGLSVTGALDLAGYNELEAVSLAANASLTNEAGGTLEFAYTNISVPQGQTAYLLNDGTINYFGTSGASNVAATTFNNGFLSVGAGSTVTFTGGFYNSGVVQGYITNNADGSVTVAGDPVGAALTYYGGADDNVFSLSAAPAVVDGGGGTNTIDVLASMKFSAGSVNNVQRFVIANGVSANLSALTGAETIIVATQPGGSASITGGQGVDTFTANNGGASIVFGAALGDLATLDPSNGDWDSVTGSAGTIDLTSAQCSVIGGSDAIQLAGSGDQVSLYNTNGNWDSATGSNQTVILNSAQCAVGGGGDTIWLNGSSSLSLNSTGGAWDAAYGSNQNVTLISAQAAIVGGGDSISLNGASSLSLSSTNGNWDYVVGSGDTDILSSAQASIVGGGDTVWLNGASSASLYSTNGNWDAVYGSNQVEGLHGAQATLIGSGNTIYLAGSNAFTLSGASDHVITAKALGEDWITGFGSTDTLQFSAQDFANFSVLQGHMTQSGSNTIIALDAGDSVTLYNVQASSLHSAQFSFV